MFLFYAFHFNSERPTVDICFIEMCVAIDMRA